MDDLPDSPTALTNSTVTNTDGAGSGIIPFNLGVWMTMAGFTAIALWNAIELDVNIFLTFRKRQGLYFWSLLVATWGVVGHALSLVFKFLTDFNPYWVCTLLMLGWWSMVNGQSLVLYSRLHLVVCDWRILRAVLIMIIVDGVLMCIPTSIVTYGASTDLAWRFLQPYRIMEKLQMTVFTLQETIISGIYIYFTANLIQPAYEGNKFRLRKALLRLLWVNIIIIAMDLTILTLEYHGDYYIETTLKSAIYSVKLKFEFTVLNQLIRLSRSSVGPPLPSKPQPDRRPGLERRGRSEVTISMGISGGNGRPEEFTFSPATAAVLRPPGSGATSAAGGGQTPKVHRAPQKDEWSLPV